jgi:phosphatidylserine decarboxylase
VRSSQAPEFADDGGLSSDDEDDEDELDDDQENEIFVDAPEQIESVDSDGTAKVKLSPPAPVLEPETPTPLSVVPTPTAPAAPQLTMSTSTSGKKFIPKMKFPKRLGSKSSTASTPTSTTASSPLPTPTLEAAAAIAATEAPVGEKKSRRKKTGKGGFQFEGTNDIVGIVMLEIQSAEDLPRLSNSAFSSLLRHSNLG